ncbi:FMN-binding negative transcriptional regulator [Mesorhizobium sp. M0968]|uniref:FMN-binding negative transcriptional regulator n=1 Tax=Mesorhizobium sp. M0968 TaxID=2957037 RepID=UPI003335DE10
MYLPAHFDEPSREVLYELIENSALGMLITHGRSGLDANHIPFELDRHREKTVPFTPARLIHVPKESAHSRSSDLFQRM